MNTIPAEIFDHIRLFLSIPDLDNFNIAVNQLDAPIPRSRVDEWFHFNFRKDWKSKLQLASHPSITLASRQLLQDYIFNLMRFDYRPPHSEYEYTHQYYLGEYEWEQDTYPERLTNDQMEDVVSEYIRKGLVNPAKQFFYETYTCLYCKTAAKKRPNLDCLNCEIFNGPFRVFEDPIAMASRISWNLVDLMLENPQVDPTVHNQKVLARAFHFKQHKVVKKLLDDRRVDPGFQGKGEVKLKVYGTTVSILPLQIAILHGWKDIYLILRSDPRIQPLSNQEKITLLAKLAKNEFTGATADLLEYILMNDDYVTNYAVKQAIAQQNWQLAKILIKHAYKGIPISVELDGVPNDVISALKEFITK
ncbi:hypothetical protein HK103_003621 [Boothiomyces macroporosus]|uniref:Uncharacterized protein n=1 Tax=Boothiomyces macroporosus TaxID=261099 RepID=A0AAD5Y8X1_9FUNG|nr:hypothetical protein HK103_003621 [Boothiomyces macroporosus]